MNVLIIGAHGKIGRLLVARLAAGGAHHTRAMVRDPAQVDALKEIGADEATVADLERDDDVRRAVQGVEAVVFTAGSGPHTGPDKTLDVDRDGAIRAIDACVAEGVRRFVMVSAMRVDEPERGPEKLRHYLLAKAAADNHLKSTELDYTILRPGRLTDEPGTGEVRAGADVGYGEIPRADVAQAIAAALDLPETRRCVVELVSGSTPIPDALRQC